MQKKLRIALIAGGTSGEREVSLNGAAGVEKALDPAKFIVQRFDSATDLVKLCNRANEIDFAFILLHGPQGEDGTVQGMLELLGIPYQGSGVLGSALAMDKHLSKKLYQQNGLPVAASQIIRDHEQLQPEQLIEQLGLPVVVKPVREGSSLGMTIAHTDKELLAGLEKARQHGREVMVEQYIQGREITVGVIGNDTLEPLPLIEIQPGEEFLFFDYKAKYEPGASKEICPAPVSETIRIKAQDYAMRAHKTLRLRGYSRTDMIMDHQENIYLLETNTIPGMTQTSLLPQAAIAAGYSFASFLEKLIELGRK